MKEQMLALLAIAGDKDVVDRIAQITWNYFQAYKEKGFTDEQAIMLTNSAMKMNK